MKKTTLLAIALLTVMGVNFGAIAADASFHGKSMKELKDMKSELQEKFIKTSPSDPQWVEIHTKLQVLDGMGV